MSAEFDFKPRPYIKDTTEMRQAASLFKHKSASEFAHNPDSIVREKSGSEYLKKTFPKENPTTIFEFTREIGTQDVGYERLILEVFADASTEADRRKHTYKLDTEYDIVRRLDTLGADAHAPFSYDAVESGDNQIPEQKHTLSNKEKSMLEEILKKQEIVDQNRSLEEDLGLNNGAVGSEEIHDLFNHVKRAYPPKK